MATSQAEVSQEIRRTVREMVQQGQSNQKIFDHIKSQYGEQQIAVPRTGLNVPLSFGVPYVMLVLAGYMVLIWGWNWLEAGNDPLSGTSSGDGLDQSEQEELETIENKLEDQPLER